MHWQFNAMINQRKTNEDQNDNQFTERYITDKGKAVRNVNELLTF